MLSESLTECHERLTPFIRAGVEFKTHGHIAPKLRPKRVK